MKFLFGWWFGITLWKRILLALVLGAVAGYFWGEGATEIKWLGDIFVRLIRMLVVPIVFVTLAAGIAGMENPAKLGSIGVKAFVLYVITTIGAIGIGLGLGTWLQPGRGVSLGDATPQQLAPPASLTDQLMAIIPLNPIQAMVEGQVLAVIFFAIIFGAGVLIAGEKAKPAAQALQAASEGLLGATRIIMEVAPFGVFALVAWVMGTSGPQAFISVFLLAVSVYAGCFIHMLFVQGGLIRLFANLPVIPFFRDIVDAQLVAYSTSSSAATLPVTMRVATENLGIKPAVASSVLPLGATVNMDGTALFVTIVALFATQVFGIELRAIDYGMIVLTTTLVSIGAASVPSASLFLLATVLSSIGITPEQTALIVGFILPFDRILDMMRTVPNITGDLAVSVTVAKWEKEIDLDVYRAKPTV
ncbi:MAG: dicarboxylate/amino acid:cation symporter [Hyphomonadaceae bacterium]